MAAKTQKKYTYMKQSPNDHYSFYLVIAGPTQGRFFSTCAEAQAYCDELNAEENTEAEASDAVKTSGVEVTNVQAPAAAATCRQLSFSDL